MSIKSKFNSIPSGKKKALIRGGLGLILGVLAIMWIFGSGAKAEKDIGLTKKSAIDYDKSIFEKTLLEKTNAEIEKMRLEIEGLKKSMRGMSIGKDGKPIIHGADGKTYRIDRDGNLVRVDKEGRVIKKAGKSNFPDPRSLDIDLSKPSKTDVNRYFPSKDTKGSSSKSTGKTQLAKPKIDMGIYTPPAKTEIETEESVRLPPSWMEANLLTGVTAPATTIGQNNPVPMLIRVNNLAVLPNEIKSQLRGCFIIAEGVGNLADERVHGRLVSLSCIYKDGGAVVDQKIKGFLVDRDGQEGMRGHIYARYGAHIARVALAGFIEGLGEAFEAANTITTSTIFGQRETRLRNTDTDTVLELGAGKGIVRAAEDLQKFYLNLAEQSLPTIEVHPTKDITVVVSEGVDLVLLKKDIQRIQKVGKS